MKFKTFLILFITVIIASACKKDDKCETDNLTYSNDIASIINTSCATAGCHESGATTTFPISNYEEVSFSVTFGRIEGSINHEEGFLPMPYGADKLDDCSIDKITQWIADGAPE